MEEETKVVEGWNNSTTTRNVGRGLNRRQVLAAGVTGAAITGFPYVSRGLAAQTLKFWQFYAPGGGVPSQDKWYEDLVKDWNARHEVKVELVYVPNNAYMDGTKLPTAFASGAGPDLFIISRAETEDAKQKLKRAGADRVLSPYQIGAIQIAQTALRPAFFAP